MSIKKLIENVFYRTPKRAVRTAAHDALLYAYLKTIPLQARRDPKAGSIR